MRRRLRILALTISVVTSLAFLVPLTMAVRRTQEDRALMAATDAARDIASFAVAIDSPTRLHAALTSLGPPDGVDVEVWYADGRAMGVGAAAVGPISASVQAALGDRSPGSERARVTTVSSEGAEILRPVTLPGGEQAVVRVTVPGSELRRGVAPRQLALVAFALVLMLASVAAADRVAAMKPPSPRGGMRTSGDGGDGWLPGPTVIATAD